MARKETRHRKFKLYVGFGKKYLYEGIWRPEESRHLDGARRASPYGENGNFSIKKNQISFSVYNSFDEN